MDKDKIVPRTNKHEASATIQRHNLKYGTLWLKFCVPEYACFVGKDAFCLSNGCHLLVRNLHNGAETVIVINDEQSGDGVSCICGHATHPFLAYAETHENPRVYVITYPELKFVMIMYSQFYQISRLAFSDGELLYGISGYPECQLAAWKWRTGELMATVSTKMLFNRSNVILKTSYSTLPVYIAQLITNTKEMKIWESGLCGKRCILRDENVTFEFEDPRLKVVDLFWAHENQCFSLDLVGNVFQLDLQSHVMKPIIRSETGDGTAAFGWHANGIVVQGSDRKIRHYLKDGTNWTLNWSIDHTFEFILMYSNPSRDYLIARTRQEDILVYDKTTEKFGHLRADDAKITHFGLIPPQNEELVTLGKETNLSLWDAATGKLLHAVNLEVRALCLTCNSYYPYFGISFENGMLRLYYCTKKVIEPMNQFHLTRVPLHDIKFFESHKIIAVANKDIGQIFIIEGTPGGKFKVLSGITHNAQIADFVVVGAKTCLRLFLIPVTSDKYIAGNTIIRYCIIKHLEPKVKTYELENPNRLYMSLYITRNQPHRDRFLYATPFDCKNLHELEVKRGDTHARVVNRFRSQHMMRMIYYIFDAHYTLSFAYDGIVIVRTLNFEIKYVIMPHHPMDGGIAACAHDFHRSRTFTLGRDGLLIASEVPIAPMTTKNQALLFAKAEELADLFKQPSSGFMPKGIYEGLTWIEYKERMQVERERLKFDQQRRKIIKDFNQIKEKAIILLNHNLAGPKNEQLDLQEFNLNLAHKEELIRNSKEECEREKNYLEKLIQEQDRISMLIKERFWDPMTIPKKNLWAIFGNFDVQSYPVLNPDLQHNELLENIQRYREIEAICAVDDTFKPWVNFTEQEKDGISYAGPVLHREKPSGLPFGLEEDELSEISNKEKQDEYESYVAYYGSTAPNFIHLFEPQYEQAEVQSYLQQHFIYTISLEEQQRMRNYFNKEFEVCVELKIREMASIIERNARLRYIISELNYFSEDLLDIDPIDPEWKQDESPELITMVDNSEVGILPYISPSEQALLDAKAAEEERIRLLLLADDFKERALMKMMNGVLEVRWEDELRREVPKPKCMTAKNPEDYNEEDLRAIREYEEAVAFLNSERERYKSILTAEYCKVGSMLRDGVKKFNDRLKELYAKKIEVESAILNEILRMHRMRVHGMRRNEFRDSERMTEMAINTNDKKTEDMSTLINSLNTHDTDLKAALDALLLKEKIVEKNFKKEFQDLPTAQYEMLTKLYKKRPRVNVRLISSHCILQEIAKAIATNKPSLLLFGDALEFTKSLDLMDKYVGILPIIDETTYHAMCRIRRVKIELELKIRACQLEIAEAENTKQMYQQHLTKYKEHSQELITQLDIIRDNQVKEVLDIEMQLVIKQAYVELPRTGSLSDFEDAVLVNRQDVEEINEIILQTGAKKIKAMTNALQFRKEIMVKEWLHQKKKMEITDLQHEILDINSVRLTKEIQQFLKTRSRGDTEKIVSFEQELDLLRSRYDRQIQVREGEVFELKQRLDQLTYENDRLNKDIMKVNIDVNEANVQVDENLTIKERKIVNMRIQANLKRSRLVNQIQENHNQILVLQAELELCRLRTVPILDYKVNP